MAEISNTAKVALFQQGRWWCAKCRVMWAGSWPVDGGEPIITHDCGAPMTRTGGDERADA